ncbi:MAG: hypothetical protein IK016_09010 [Lachnospiraceae bacterium]|nr:hypothetical protein [Lachnospiraceae bacterium]
MRIADSQIMMGAGRNYLQQTAGGARESTFSASLSRYAGTACAKDEESPEVLGARRANVPAETEEVDAVDTPAEGNGLLGIRDALLEEILQRMLSAGMFVGFGSFMGFAGLGFGGLGLQFDRGGMTYTQLNYMEQEQTSFFSQGYAQTEDGRVIDFNVKLEMSRAFLDYTQIRIPMMNSVLFDPLVINVGSACTSLSDKTFRFDLDTDGEEDDISMLKEGSGFLALDKNGDGIINDGTELFGVKSGNGFADLQEYDSDGNGWIDENDEVFSKLRVWYRNEDGRDELVDLKTADVGAIFLGHEQTDFSLYGEQMRMNGMIRATGMFLKESGGAGTLQHVDLALQHGQGQTLSGEGSLDAAGKGTIYDVNLLNGSNRGALVIDFTDGKGQTQALQSGQEDAKAEQEQTKETKKDPKAEAAARRKAQQQKRMEEADRRKAMTERYYERRQLRKEQLEKLFEERMAEKEAMNDALYTERLEENAQEQQMLSNALEHEEALGELVEEQIMAVA